MLRLPDESAAQLARRLADLGSSPSEQAVREELRQRVRPALDRLAPGDREVLVLRHLEQLSTAEAAAVLGIGEGAVKIRHLRALQRLRALLRRRHLGRTVMNPSASVRSRHARPVAGPGGPDRGD